MERKHFLTLGAGLTVGGLIGKSALNGENISGAKTKISDYKFDPEKPFPISPEGDVNHPEQDGPYWDFIRTLFPLKSDLTFLNNGTMGITPYPVLEALNKSFHHIAENGAYPMHDGSFEENLGQILGCKGSELAITKNVSEGVNLACRAISLKKGDEVIITLHEHVGGCAAWLYRAKTEGIVLKLAALGATAEETLNNIKSVKTKNTKVIAVPHIPCTIGQVLPVNEICAWAKANGIISAIDGAHPLGMLHMNLKEMGCDYYSGCFHKWLLGPIGTGFFYASEEILSRSAIHHVAAYSVDKFDMSTTPPSMGGLVNKTARYSYGTFPGPMYDGAKAAMQFYQKIGPALIEKRVKYLSKEVMNGLMEINDNPSLKFPVIEVLTPAEDASRGAQVGFRIHEHPSKIASSNAQVTKEGAPIAITAISQSLVPGTSTPQASQRFCDFARKNNVILRYVAENNIHCVRVSTHYYNNKDNQI
ncbi:MAG: aminotransferase class V-fold PLP-dependent enzyme [Bacteroidetes bacterium]|nr:aminotransferase class V-fold PLP-dependent enzyme [Bacteroidota bacterium]